MSETNNDPSNGTSVTSDADGFLLGAGNGGSPSPETFIDPASATSGGSDSRGPGAPGKRGRPRGSKNAKSKSGPVKAADLGPFAGIIFGLHSMLASVAKTPELELDKGESEQLAKASFNVMRHYAQLDVSEKVADWCNLFMALGGVYGPRVMAHKIRADQEKAARHAMRQQQQQPQPQKPPSVGAQILTMPLQQYGSGSDIPGGQGGPGVA